MVQAFRQWWQVQWGGEQSPFDGEASSFLVSFVVHLFVLVLLGLVPLATKVEESINIVSTAPAEEVVEMVLPKEFAFSEQPSEEIGANSVQGTLVALSAAPVMSEVTAIPNYVPVMRPVENAQIEINNLVERATGLHINQNLAVKGAAGEGTTGAAGAIDRITHEILLSLEERKTLIVWLFDQTESLIPQRKVIRDRFEKIYRELGIIEAAGSEQFVKYDSKPLLSTIIGFGNGLNVMTKKPTDNLAELRKAVMDIPKDTSGTENVFAAIYESSKQYASFRHAAEKGEPERNVMIIVFTDEAGSDAQRAEETIKMCRRWAMPVYVVGVPAPFGRKVTLMKWIDPDPKYSQEEQWGEVEQGPETFLPERIKVSFSGSREDDDAIDSGFGPYALTRLCYETGGIYFAVHPNRNVNRSVGMHETAAYSAHLKHFFDPEVMRRYRPDYVSIQEYQKRISQNKARAALIQAAASSTQIDAMEDPRLRFVKADEAEFARQLSAAQQAAAALEPRINSLYQILQQGESDRDKETVARWMAGYDLAMGRTLAIKVRTESYNAMLAAAKRGLKPKDPKNNTWILRPSDEISVGSQYAKLAERAKMYLNRVVKDHPGTPWAMLAQRELKDPLGWTWHDEYTDQTPKKAKMGGGNPAPPRNDEKKMLEKPLPKRPPPKL